MSEFITKYTPPKVVTIKRIKLSVNVYELKFNEHGQLVYFNNHEVKPSNNNQFNFDKIGQFCLL